ncbi:MAG: helix-turn-helix transcriptional regulator [Corynebacteriales bacterium]|nr:helix-turn-helix transcriptional regulator [Mycobacteriales bacterium]
MSDIGERLRIVRQRRGLTQQELARHSTVSLSLVRKVEQGDYGDTRLETVRKLAVALRVPTSSLLHAPEPETQNAGIEWEALKQALWSPPADAIDEAPTIDGVAQALNAAMPLFATNAFTELAMVLPALLRDADAVVAVDPTAGRSVRARLLHLTGWLLTQTRHYDTAQHALERALDDAPDHLVGAAAANTMCWVMLRRGDIDGARALAIRWADDVEPRISRASREELAAWGWMLLRVSAAAMRDNRDGEAQSAMRLAQSAAAALGREYAQRDDIVHTFGPVTVALKTTENAMVADKPDSVLALAETVPFDSGQRATSSNINRHLLDVACAYARTKRTPEAVGILSGIGRTSPQWLKNQRFARDIVTTIIGRRRTLTTEMRALADAVGVPL